MSRTRERKLESQGPLPPSPTEPSCGCRDMPSRACGTHACDSRLCVECFLPVPLRERLLLLRPFIGVWRKGSVEAALRSPGEQRTGGPRRRRTASSPPVRISWPSPKNLLLTVTVPSLGRSCRLSVCPCASVRWAGAVSL